MIKSLRFLTILFLLLLSILTLYASWATLQPHHKSPPFSHTSLLNLAAIDTASTALHNATASLLATTPTNHSALPTHILLLLNRLLRAWLRLRDRHTAIVPDLLRNVKRPIDLHYGYPDTARPYGSCAVVGNSGVLLRSHLADLIDGHDIVIRLNYARVSGYESHVGFKTSISFINTNVLHLCARRKGCRCRLYGDFVPVVMYICQAEHFVDYVVCNSTSSAPMIVTDPRLDLLCGRIVKYYSMRRFVERTGRRVEEWGEVRDEKVFHYSSGMQAVVLALGICDQVSLLGFGKPVGVKHHYHTNQKAELDLHDYEAEYDFYGDLVHWPQVIPFLKEAGFDATQVVFYQ